MAKNFKKKLVIVESPAKANTIVKYLGKDFVVLASFGHVRDLPKKRGSIDTEHEFQPKYQIIARNKQHLDDIVEYSLHAEQIYLATDPDREGEAISWHILEVLKQHKINTKSIKRISFNEITANVVRKSIDNARDINMHLVDAQQARLILDYLIGFNISPLLWKKIKPGLSAGRVQSPALRLICDREQEIKSFVPSDYFSIILHSHKDSHKLSAKLVKYQDEKIDTKTIDNKKYADQIYDSLHKSKHASVIDIVKKQKKKHPFPPLITSSLQIAASHKLGFSADQTMKIAQTLYEGVDISHEIVGLISYMRTDSVHLSEEAITEIREYISKEYTANYLPDKPNTFTNKVKNAQEAHEAIRPTSIMRTPSSIKQFLTVDQYKLYDLIWRRTLSSQMVDALFDTTKIDLEVKQSIFRLTGFQLNFDGFMAVYSEDKIDHHGDDEEEEIALPEIALNSKLPIDNLEITAHQTQPKPRYTEATLVKTLEEFGIGRPSTYASIISILKKRSYVVLEKRRFVPTETGSIVNHFLTEHMTRYVDYKFTALLEDKLDDISNSTLDKQLMLKSFWHDLEKDLEVSSHVSKAEVVSEQLEEACPECGHNLIKRFGKYGSFIGCSGYPECHYMRKIDNVTGESVSVSSALEIVPDRICPKDGGVLVIRHGRYGDFISCKNYPKCKFIENILSPDEKLITCPECKTGHIIKRKNRFGKWFYACDNYPECKIIFNYPVLDKVCPSCSYPVLMHKTTKVKGDELVCKQCDYIAPFEHEE